MRYVKLKANSKKPKPNKEGHHDIVDYNPGKNYGICLDNEFVVIDFDKDHPQREEIESLLPPTWSQRTGRRDAVGMHYLYKIPQGYKHKNSYIYTRDNTHIGEIKFQGYVVSPGTIVLDEPGKDLPYTRTNDLDPVLISQEDLDRLLGLGKGLKTNSIAPTRQDEFDVMPDGTRDNSLYKIGSTLRKVGYSEKGIAIGLEAIVQSGLVEQPEGREIVKSDIKRLAKSCSGYETEIEPVFNISFWRNAMSLEDEQPNIEWILHRFIPQNKLTFQYGKGGIGKSSWIPWLVSNLLQKGLRVGFSATEETFERFSNAVRLSTKDFDRSIFNNLYDIDNDWMFPRDEKKLRTGLELCHLDFIYFDSIYDIFDPKGAGIFTNTRQCLKPLSIICQDMNITIMGTFHENKGGTFNGSKEMESIPRSLIHATEDSNRLRLHVEKSNNKKPDYDLLSIGSWVPESNPNGTVVKERNENGELVDSEIFIVSGFEKTEEKINIEGGIELSKLEVDTYNDEAFDAVYKCKKEHPTWGRKSIAMATGYSEKIVRNRLEKLGFVED